MKPIGVYLLFVLLMVNFPQLLRADIVYPARLEIKEVEPQVFMVTFNLPLINNRRIKAQPLLPAVCEDITPHEIKVAAGTYTETWRIHCDPRQLFGREIRIEGLIGTRTDVILLLQMLDGRAYAATLKPARAVFVMPVPPSLPALVGKAMVSGMRAMLRNPVILLLLFLLAFLARDRRSPGEALAAFLVAHASGQFLAQQQWLQLSPYLSPLLAAFVAVLATLKLTRGESSGFSQFQPLWPLALFLGAMYGGANPQTLPPEGLSRFEQQFVFTGFNSGFAAGLLLGYMIMVEIRVLLSFLPHSLPPETEKKMIVYFGGTSAIALFLYQLSVFIFFPSILPDVPPEFFLTAIVLGVWLRSSALFHQRWVPIILLLLLIAGLTAGLSSGTFPMASFVLPGSLFFFGLTLATGRRFPLKISLIIAGAAVLYHTGHVGYAIQENLSRPVANAVGAAVLAVFAGYLSYRLANHSGEPLRMGIRLTGGIAALVAILLRSREYLEWFNTTVATEYALGLVRLPLLSLALLIAGLAIWPRRRKIHQHLNLKTRKQVAHLALLALAFFMLPFGSFKAKNLFFTPDAPRDEQARRILQQVLSNTYNAFNLSDENRLYDQLSQSVSGELVANLYLDNRRRLRAGVRQGAEVTVKEVRVLSLGETVQGTSAAGGFSYQCKWVVTARVKHLQHVHHRKNIYSGILTIKVIDEKWKIERVALQSEDRVVIPGRAG